MKLTSTDIETMLTNQVPEQRTLDYKRTLPGSSESDRKEFAADVTSFANTAGGNLIFGIDEDNGVPTKIVGVSATDVDSEILRLDSILLTGALPRVPHETYEVLVQGKSVIVIRIDQSWEAPHRVVVGGSDKFWGRTSNGKYSLDVGELRQAFLRIASAADRIRQFRQERIVEIAAGRTPVRLNSRSQAVLHAIPLEAFTTSRSFDVSRTNVPPLGGGGWNHRITLEGRLTYSPLADGAISSYSHMYRNGVIEGVNTNIAHRGRDESCQISSAAMEQDLMVGTERLLAALKALGVAPPVYLAVTLVGLKGCRLGAKRAWANEGYPIDREALFLPDLEVSDLSNLNSVSLMRPTIDLIWNACGYEGSPHFDSQGAWDPRR